MQELVEFESYDAIVSLSWSFNYVNSVKEAKEVLIRFSSALRAGGQLILQIAHAPNATGKLQEDREPGPEGQTADILFLYRFSQAGETNDELRARYVYGCASRNELVFEEHRLCAANAREIAALASDVGFQGVELLDSWRGEPLDQSLNALLLARRP